MSLNFSLECSQAHWRRHFWWPQRRETLVASRDSISGTGSATEVDSMTSTYVVDQEVQRQTVERQPDRYDKTHLTNGF